MSTDNQRFKNLTIVTTTLYKDDEVSLLRRELAMKFLDNAQKLGVKVVVIDGGSSQEFLDEIGKYSNIELMIDPKLGMGASRRAGFQKALAGAATEYVLWSEPEKSDLIKEESLSAMLEELESGAADIVVPKRKSKETMPEFQASEEDYANRRATNLLCGRKPEAEITEGEVFDLWFGPKMFNRQGAQPFLDYGKSGEMDYWDSIIKPAVVAERQGLRVSSVEVDFQYDSREKVLETGKNKNLMEWKRALQGGAILTELGDEYWQERAQFGRLK